MTSESTRNLIERESPGLSIATMRKSLDTTPMGMRSRAVCGIRRRSLIVNLSRSMKVSQECLEIIYPALPHTIDLLRDPLTDVRATHHARQSQRGSHQSSLLHIQMPLQHSMRVAHSHASNMDGHGPPASLSMTSAMKHGNLVRNTCGLQAAKAHLCDKQHIGCQEREKTIQKREDGNYPPYQRNGEDPVSPSTSHKQPYEARTFPDSIRSRPGFWLHSKTPADKEMTRILPFYILYPRIVPTM